MSENVFNDIFPNYDINTGSSKYNDNLPQKINISYSVLIRNSASENKFWHFLKKESDKKSGLSILVQIFSYHKIDIWAHDESYITAGTHFRSNQQKRKQCL